MYVFGFILYAQMQTTRAQGTDLVKINQLQPRKASQEIWFTLPPALKPPGLLYTHLLYKAIYYL